MVKGKRFADGCPTDVEMFGDIDAGHAEKVESGCFLGKLLVRWQ